MNLPAREFQLAIVAILILAINVPSLDFLPAMILLASTSELS